jgi:hypothetical protein
MSELGLWGRWKKNLGDTRPWDLWDPEVERANDEEAARRYTICMKCPELVKLTKQCKKCGCFMAAKAKLAEAVCPAEKW